MRALVAAVSLVIVFSAAAQAQRRTSLVPPGWTQVYKDTATRTRRFRSADGAVTMTTSQTRSNPAERTREQDAIARRPGEAITYERRAPTWIAVSGYRGDDIFYRKSNIACGGRRWNNVEFVYPRADKKRLDATVTAVARGMTRYADDCG
jgi:hypothetical protein